MRTDRPYEPLHMTTAMWMAVPPARIAISRLRYTNDVDEHIIDSKHPLSSACGDPFPHVVEHRGWFYVADGNHRVRQRELEGDTHTVARVLRELA